MAVSKSGSAASAIYPLATAGSNTGKPSRVELGHDVGLFYRYWCTG